MMPKKKVKKGPKESPRSKLRKSKRGEFAKINLEIICRRCGQPVAEFQIEVLEGLMRDIFKKAVEMADTDSTSQINSMWESNSIRRILNDYGIQQKKMGD
jgi:hypothetical protein